MPTSDLYRLAADLVAEHGACARDYARQAILSFHAEGESDRAAFWSLLSVLLDDIFAQRIDPDRPIVVH
jgi:hypothetical protein